MNKRLILLVGATVLVASACVKINLDIEVFEDGSAEISGIIALNADAVQEIAESFGEGFGEADLIGSRDELCSEFIDDADLGDDQTFSEMETKPYDEDGFCGIEFSGKLAPDQVIAQMGGLTGGQDGTLRRDGDGWFFELPLEAEGLGTEGLEGAEDFIDIDELFGGAEYIVKVKLPGVQVEHNGDYINEDGAVVWEIELLAPPSRLFLRTEAGETITGNTPGGTGGSTGLIIVIVVAALAALGAGAYFLTRNKTEAAVAVPGVPAPPLDHAPGAQPPVAAPEVRDFAAPPQSTQPEPGPAPAPDPAPAPESSPETSPSDKAADPQVIASPTPEQATDSPVWDPVRRQYVQWDTNTSGWLVYDDAQQAWRPDS